MYVVHGYRIRCCVKNKGRGIRMIHSKSLEETVLWKVYQEKIVSESTRASWVKEFCAAAVKYMMDVRHTFQNYTLHDRTHIINVLDAMGGVLGNQVSQLTVGEMELLIPPGILPHCSIPTALWKCSVPLLRQEEIT